MKAKNNPEDPAAGTRDMPFTRELFIDQSDFMEDPPSPKKWYRLGPDREVRLKFGYIIKCTGYEKDESGTIKEIFAEYDPETKSGEDTSGKKVKGTLGWVSARHAINAEIRLYDRLFLTENLASIKDDFKNHLNPDSLQINGKAVLEPATASLEIGNVVQFERIGYFRLDEDSTEQKKVFNRTITLRDNWSK